MVIPAHLSQKTQHPMSLTCPSFVVILLSLCLNKNNIIPTRMSIKSSQENLILIEVILYDLEQDEQLFQEK